VGASILVVATNAAGAGITVTVNGGGLIA